MFSQPPRHNSEPSRHHSTGTITPDISPHVIHRNGNRLRSAPPRPPKPRLPHKWLLLLVFYLVCLPPLLDASGSLYIPRPHKQPREKEKERPRPLCPSSSSSGLRGPLRVFYTLAAKRLRRGLRETRGSVSGTSKRMRPSQNQPLDVILFLPPREDTVYRDRCLCITASLSLPSTVAVSLLPRPIYEESISPFASRVSQRMTHWWGLISPKCAKGERETVRAELEAEGKREGRTNVMVWQ